MSVYNITKFMPLDKSHEYIAFEDGYIKLSDISDEDLLDCMEKYRYHTYAHIEMTIRLFRNLVKG